MRTLYAHTFEMDDFEVAIAEIHAQLDLANNQRANTLGILACHKEFVRTGAAQAICKSLPFEVIGSVTTTQAVPGQEGDLILTLLVLTSDEERFSTALTDTLNGPWAQSIEDGYKKAAAALPGAPALALILTPFMVQNSGDAYVDVLTRVSGGVPCFGTMSIDNSNTFADCFVLCGGEAYIDRMAIALVHGDIHPRFFLATISKEKILPQSALITSSDGHLLKEVNGRPVIEYFTKLNLVDASQTSYAMASLPFVVDYNDGTPPVSKVFISLDEEQHAICAGAMPEGSTLYLGVFDKQDVLLTTRTAVEQALAETNPSVMLIYSCIARSISLGGEVMVELETVQDALGTRCPFMMAYSGGEFCPTQVRGDKAINRFHNNSFILCAF
ncbi:MAG: FIST C-terminal domain-containing protein [Oscillospiraceae bacterium]|jgi:hypothetical protein|nr:FIST C-terminal domain-containing protein [Oscillospiraceae bacterium]